MRDNLMDELWQKFKMLDAAIKELRSRGSAYAQAEQDYRVELAKCILLEREKGTPVTIISDVCRGDRTIAGLKFNRDVADVVYKSALEAVNVYKLQIRILDEQIEREWGHAPAD
ncbi:Uncharacterised protein [uncultured Clostridium sp.]|nr:Uncharacterised protein [uncultured Clostridium sp.]